MWFVSQWKCLDLGESSAIISLVANVNSEETYLLSPFKDKSMEEN